MSSANEVRHRAQTRRAVGSLLAAGFLALAFSGVAMAQDDDGEQVYWVFAGNLAGHGEYTGFAGIPGGTVSNVSVELGPINSGVWLYDPGEPGGDTFEIHETGPAGPQLSDGTFIAVPPMDWEIKNGTGAYASLTGSGQMLGAVNADKDMGVSAYFGTISGVA